MSQRDTPSFVTMSKSDGVAKDKGCVDSDKDHDQPFILAGLKLLSAVFISII